MQGVMVASSMDVAAGQRVEQSMMVKIYLLPSDGGRVLMMFTWMWPKRLVG